MRPSSGRPGGAGRGMEGSVQEKRDSAYFKHLIPSYHHHRHGNLQIAAKGGMLSCSGRAGGKRGAFVLRHDDRLFHVGLQGCGHVPDPHGGGGFRAQLRYADRTGDSWGGHGAEKSLLSAERRLSSVLFLGSGNRCPLSGAWPGRPGTHRREPFWGSQMAGFTAQGGRKAESRGRSQFHHHPCHAARTALVLL